MLQVEIPDWRSTSRVRDTLLLVIHYLLCPSNGPFLMPPSSQAAAALGPSDGRRLQLNWNHAPQSILQAGLPSDDEDMPDMDPPGAA